MRYLLVALAFTSFLYADSLTKNGAGILTLTGDSSATLGAAVPITVNAGTLVVNNTLGSLAGMLTFDTSTLHIQGAAFSSGRAVALIGNATFDIDAGTSTFSGAISNVGSLTKTNTAATLVLGTTNTFSGGTTIQGGTLSLTAVSALPNNGSVTLENSAAVQVNDNNQTIGALSSSSGLTTVNLGVMGATVFSIGNGGASSSFSGVISGTGQIEKDGAGTLTLLGANTYAGLTTITAGTLVGNTTSLQGGSAGRVITDNALLIFDQAADGTYGNTITGVGALTKQNAGILTFSSPSVVALINPATSIVDVQGGTLSVVGFVGAHEVTVQAGTTLKGNGLIAVTAGIGGKVDVFGTCAPGTSIDTLHIIGDYVQEAGSTLEIELNAAGDTDLIDATGTVTINGGTLALMPDFGTYNPLTQYTIISAGAVVVNSAFNPVTSTLPSFEAEVHYFPTKVVLLVNLVPFSDLVIGGNAGQVARCLDSAVAPDGSDLSTVIDFLHFMSLAQMEDTMDQMQPSLFNALDLAEEETLVRMRDSLSRRQAYLFFKGCGPKRTCQGWSDFFRVQSSQNNQHGEPGFEATTLASVAGFDYLWTEFCLGGAVGYARDDLDWKKKRGSADIDSYYAMLYSSWNSKFCYVQGAIIGTGNNESAVRRIEFAGTEFLTTIRQAKHRQWEGGGLANLELGLFLGDQEKKAEIRPYGRVDYVFLHRWPFHETGARSIDLDVESHNADLLRGEAGLRLSKCFPAQDYRVTYLSPYVQISGVWERRYLGTVAKAHFVHSDCIMTVRGLNPDRNLIAGAVGLAVRGCGDHFMLSSDFQGEWGSNYRDTTWALRAKLEF